MQQERKEGDEFILLRFKCRTLWGVSFRTEAGRCDLVSEICESVHVILSIYNTKSSRSILFSFS